jgi:hypothetical protein
MRGGIRQRIGPIRCVAFDEIISGHFLRRPDALDFLSAPMWAWGLRTTQYEHMFSALPSNSDIARRSRHVSNVPLGDLATMFEMNGSAN